MTTAVSILSVAGSIHSIRGVVPLSRRRPRPQSLPVIKQPNPEQPQQPQQPLAKIVIDDSGYKMGEIETITEKIMQVRFGEEKYIFSKRKNGSYVLMGKDLASKFTAIPV